MATPLLVALVVIETTDLIFALDSIPAVFAVTRDPFLVYTSNVFALLGLRSLYFVSAGAIRKLRFLRIGLGILLLFVAAKMLLADVIEIPPLVSLAVVAGIIGVAIVASRLFPGATPGAAAEAPVACTHRDQIRDLRPETDKCAECVRSGDRWVDLRMCLTAETSPVATVRKIGTRRSTSTPPAIRSCGRSNRARTGSGAMSIV